MSCGFFSFSCSSILWGPFSAFGSPFYLWVPSLSRGFLSVVWSPLSVLWVPSLSCGSPLCPVASPLSYFSYTQFSSFFIFLWF